MDTRGYIALVIVVAAILIYFLFIVPSSSPKPHPISTTSINASKPLNQTTNQTNQSAGIGPTGTRNTSQAGMLWVATRPYPTPIGKAKCTIQGNYTYCIGGQNNTVNATSTSFFARITNNGLSAWNETIPLPIMPSSCLINKNHIYCISGELLSGSHNQTNFTYYTSVNNTGFGLWNQTLSLPYNGSSRGCAVAGVTVYCVGEYKRTGNMGTHYQINSNAMYAPISSSGIGQWSYTTPLPVSASPQCFIHSFTIYCVGQYINNQSHYANFAYYAPVNLYGIQSWKSTKPPPNPAVFTCNYYSPFLYCIGGYDNKTGGTDVYYTGLSIGGVNGWHKALSYPLFNATSASCETYNGTTACIGGQLRNFSYVNKTFFTRSFLT